VSEIIDIFSLVVIVCCWCLCSVVVVAAVAVVKEQDACSVVKEHMVRVVI